MRLKVAGLGPDPDAPLIAVERRAALLPVYTAITIVAGIGGLILVTLFGTLPAAIAVPGIAAPWGGVAGVAAWTVFGLAGSLKVVRGPSGHGVLTFHLPFIVAAMVLGGPIAGGWVAFIASFERRELREMPWYGALANHAGLALAAIVGGVAAQAAVSAASGLGLPGGLAITLLGSVVGTLVLAVVQTALAAGVIVLRDGLDAAGDAPRLRSLVPGHPHRGDHPRLGVRRHVGRCRVVGARAVCGARAGGVADQRRRGRA